MTEINIPIDAATLKLLNEFGFIQSEKDPKLYEIEIENGKAFVDFRKENGRRYTIINGKSGKPDNIPILQAFKEARDKLQSSSVEHSEKQPPQNHAENLAGNAKRTIPSHEAGDKSKLGTPDTGEQKREAIPGNMGKDTNTPPILSSSTGVKIPPSPSPTKTVWDELATAYEFDIVEIFGNAGDGKSKTALKIAMDAIVQGKKVKYIDTERGFLRSEREKLGSAYQYISNMRDLMSFVRNIPADIDFLVIDSVGYPVLTEWAKMGVNERGNALTQIIAVKDYIKDWAINNNKIALVINQPDSDFGKAADYVNRPFGDKGQFVIKEVFRIERKVSSPTMTKSVLKVFRSRHDARDIVVATIEITNDGVKIS